MEFLRVPALHTGISRGSRGSQGLLPGREERGERGAVNDGEAGVRAPPGVGELEILCLPAACVLCPGLDAAAF